MVGQLKESKDFPVILMDQPKMLGDGVSSSSESQRILDGAEHKKRSQAF